MAYVPDRGHLVWLDFTPQAGHEQAGRRPALVLSPLKYNQFSGLCILCPITNTKRGFRTQVPIPVGEPVTGVVLADHVKSLDYKSRRVEYLGVAGREVLDAVTEIILSLVDPADS